MCKTLAPAAPPAEFIYYSLPIKLITSQVYLNISPLDLRHINSYKLTVAKMKQYFIISEAVFTASEAIYNYIGNSIFHNIAFILSKNCHC